MDTRIAATAAEYDHTSLALATWALGKVAHRPSAQLSAALRRRMADVAGGCNPQNLTNLVSGFAMMGCPLTGDDLEVRRSAHKLDCCRLAAAIRPGILLNHPGGDSLTMACRTPV